MEMHVSYIIQWVLVELRGVDFGVLLPTLPRVSSNQVKARAAVPAYFGWQGISRVPKRLENVVFERIGEK